MQVAVMQLTVYLRMQLTVYLRMHLPLRASWSDMLRAEIAGFPGRYPGRYSDMVDSLVWALLYCRQLAAARREDSFYAQQLQGFSLFGR
jgi:hypothetical protein